MKKILFILCAALLAGCAAPQNYSGELIVPPLPTEAPVTEYIPLNYEKQVGMWLPYTDFDDYMHDEAGDFTAALSDILREARNSGVNTVYFHAHPNGDSYYSSLIYPRGASGDYDPLRIVLDTAHELGLSVHAWINPYRMQTITQMNSLTDDFIVKKWVDENSPMVKAVGERYYLNPAYSEVTVLICETANEIINNYDVDGIHIDDYFYPAADSGFDIEAYRESRAENLDDWRRQNISGMVSALYDTVKSHDMRLCFGVSPQGNIDIDYNRQYADVERWTSVRGYCDYIVPQIYFGFRNETCPFEATLRRWEELTAKGGISLVVGLAAYKLGEYDKWAGESGEYEWIEDGDIIERQIECVRNSSADGYAIFK